MAASKRIMTQWRYETSPISDARALAIHQTGGGSLGIGTCWTVRMIALMRGVGNAIRGSPSDLLFVAKRGFGVGCGGLIVGEAKLKPVQCHSR